MRRCRGYSRALAFVTAVLTLCATPHDGIRTKQHSLNECIVCHVQPDASGQFASSDSPEHFCNSCHTWAAVSIDCFQCHAAHPGKDAQASRLGQPTTPHAGAMHSDVIAVVKEGQP